MAAASIPRPARRNESKELLLLLAHFPRIQQVFESSVEPPLKNESWRVGKASEQELLKSWSTDSSRQPIPVAGLRL